MEKYLYIVLPCAAIVTFIATWLILKKLIPILKSHKIGQKIYEIGPRWHMDKQGTPIMGGVAFIIPAFVIILLFAVYTLIVGPACFREYLPVFLTFAMALLSGLIGFFDDYTKLIKKQNQGFKAWQKLALQLIAAAAYVISMKAAGAVSTSMQLPFTDKTVELGAAYYIISVLIIAGIDNAVNITDGIDGLCSSVTAVIAVLFTAVSFVSGSLKLGLPAAVTLGGCLGFLVYNFHPARIFMGDTGSLYLGGTVVGLAWLADEPLIVFICGIIYIIEILSVVLQVSYFKLTHGKRIFKMAPIHHHFEKCGWSEVKIVAVFSAITVLGCIAAWFGIGK